MKVPFLDLSLQYTALASEIDAAISKVVHSQKFILGPEVGAFETAFAEYLGVPYSLGVSSGTDALLLALMALDISPGDEVITSPFTFFATVGCIHRLGATPKFVDIDPITFNLDAEQVVSALSDKTKGIIPVHLFGQSAEMSKVLAVAKKYSLPVIEDVAQSTGASYADKKLGSLGSFGTFSFFPAKNLGCYGDGGAVSCQDQAMYEKMKSLRNHGSVPHQKYVHTMVGGNFRLDTLQAAILLVKLKHLDPALEKRRANATRYDELISEKGIEKGIEVLLPKEVTPCTHTYNQYVVRLPRRDRYVESASERGIGAAVYYPIALHLQDCFSHLGYAEGDFPEAERACKEVVALPIYPELPMDHQEAVVDCIIESQL